MKVLLIDVYNYNKGGAETVMLQYGKDAGRTWA